MIKSCIKQKSNEKCNETMINLNKLSVENLKKFQKVLKITLDELEFQGVKKCNKIPTERFKKEKLYYDDVISVLERINGENIRIVNEYYREKGEKENSILSPHYKLQMPVSGSEIIKEQIRKELHPIESLGVEDELDMNIIVIVKNLNQVKKIKEKVDKKLKEIAINRAKEIRRQFEESSKKEKEALKKEIIEEIKEDKDKIKTTTIRPFCVIEGKWGFLKFSKYGKKIKIGQPNSRHFKLLQCLSELSGVARTIDSVFEAIRLPKDAKDSKLTDYNTAKNRKIELIQYTIKELQKNKELKGKLKFQFSDTKREIRLETQ